LRASAANSGVANRRRKCSRDRYQLKDELAGVSSEVQRVTGQQAKKAKNDKWATGVEIVLLWPALLFLASGDKAEKLANLKGQYNAIVTSAKVKKCDYAVELRPA
jgi:hypothetical protein